MKYLVLGANGFIGSRAYEHLKSEGVDVVGAGREASDGILEVDLFDKKSVKGVLQEVNPDIIISCAGIVENSEKAILSNPIFTMNILQSIVELGIKPQKILISGSAGEYGVVGHADSVGENTSLLAENNYARSKVLETSVAMHFSAQNNLPVFVYRPFNPIGTGMHPRFLIPNIINQLKEVKIGKRDRVEVSRKDAYRDYVDVRDIASAIHCIASADLSDFAYNIGLGRSVSNEELVTMVAKELGLPELPEIVNTQEKPEPAYAIKADITRLTSLGWQSEFTTEETVREIVKEYNGKN